VKEATSRRTVWMQEKKVSNRCSWKVDEES